MTSGAERAGANVRQEGETIPRFRKLFPPIQRLFHHRPVPRRAHREKKR